MNSSPSSKSKSSSGKSKSGASASASGALKKVSLAAVALLGLLGLIFSGSIGTLYSTGVTIDVANQTDASRLASATSDSKTLNSLFTAAGAQPNKGDSIQVAQNPNDANNFTLTVQASNGQKAIAIADKTATALIAEVDQPNFTADGTTGPVLTAHIDGTAAQTGSSISANSPISPEMHVVELWGFTIALLLGILGILGEYGVVPMPSVTKPTRPAAAKAPTIKASDQPKTKVPAPLSAEASKIEATLPSTAFASPQPPPAAIVHTLVTITEAGTPIGSRFEPDGQIVFSSGSADNSSSSPLPSSSHITDDADDDLPLKTDVDAILFQRLDEYKAYKPNEGCVLLVTETMAADNRPSTASTKLNGAKASLSFARKIAEVRHSPTLLIDTGSEVWSAYKHQPNADDVIGLPPVEGVYEIIKSGAPTKDWLILEDDEIPGFMGLGSGAFLRTGPRRLQSDGMRALIKKARSIADLIVIYAPRCIERPEIIRTLDGWTNGVLIVSGVDPTAEAAEKQALSMLRSSGATIFGRIALDTLNFSAESDSDLRAAQRSSQPRKSEDAEYVTAPA